MPFAEPVVSLFEGIAEGYLVAFAPECVASGAALRAILTLDPWQRRWLQYEGVWWISDDAITHLARAVPAVAEALARWQQRPDDPLRWLREYESGGASAGAGGFASVRRILLLPPRVRAAYATLGLRPGAGAEEVTARRRALAREHHPDVGGDTGAMVAINAATDTLLAWLRREEAPAGMAAGG